MLFRSKKLKQHKSIGVLIVCHFLTSQSWRDKWHVSWFNDFVSRLSLETKPPPKSWPTLSIVWRRLKLLMQSVGNITNLRNNNQQLRIVYCWWNKIFGCLKSSTAVNTVLGCLKSSRAVNAVSISDYDQHKTVYAVETSLRVWKHLLM